MTNEPVSQQAGMFDREMDREDVEGMDSILESGDRNFNTVAAALTALTNDRNVKGAQQVARARRALKKIVKDLKLKNGERVRVGDFILEGKLRSYGPAEIPKGEAMTIGSVESVG